MLARKMKNTAASDSTHMTANRATDKYLRKPMVIPDLKPFAPFIAIYQDSEQDPTFMIPDPKKTEEENMKMAIRCYPSANEIYWFSSTPRFQAGRFEWEWIRR